MRFEFLSEIYDHSVCEIRDPSLTIILHDKPCDSDFDMMLHFTSKSSFSFIYIFQTNVVTFLLS